MFKSCIKKVKSGAKKETIFALPLISFLLEPFRDWDKDEIRMANECDITKHSMAFANHSDWMFRLKHGISIRDIKYKSLAVNYNFVECLMGFPIGWHSKEKVELRMNNDSIIDMLPVVTKDSKRAMTGDIEYSIGNAWSPPQAVVAISTLIHELGKIGDRMIQPDLI